METLATLRSMVAGAVIGPDDPGFDEARAIWNGMIDRRPAAIVRAGSVGDIAPTIEAARALGLRIAVRGGGHNVAGNGTVDGGIVLDLGGLTAVDVDPERRVVRVEPGATLGHLDRATEPHGLAVPVGVISGTGVAGLTLGGGIGWLTHAHGLAVDNLLEVELVTADGSSVRASETENPALFWGVRGGGGNFGVVSSFSFRAHPLGPDVYAGTLVSRPDHWAAALRGLETWSRGDVPDPITVIATFMTPRPEFELGDEPVMLIGFAWASPDRAAGERVVDGLRAATAPDVEVIVPTTWAAWQSAADGLFPKGSRAYWKNTSFDRLDDATIEVIVRRGREQTWDGTGFDIHLMEGAFGRVSEDATPFVGRSARYWLNIYGYWADAADDAARTAFVKGFAADMTPHATGAQYVNFLGQEGSGSEARASALAVYGPAKLERLIALKRRYDPDNLFRLNHNIPTG
ncbi:MAG TPA: FAD-binding oxidoreductase [Candidatus Limnocylindrales bacterium]